MIKRRLQLLLKMKRPSSFRFSHQNNSSPNHPQCLVLHPVTYPNKGPSIEQYLAEQAIGLVSSLNWNIVKGPFWKSSSVEGGMQNITKFGKLPPNTIYIEPQFGSEIKDGTYVRSSIGKGIFYKDGIIFDENQTQTDGDLHSQWQNKRLRESLANSSLIKCKKVTQKYYFTKGKLQRIVAHVLSQQATCLFINTQLKPGQIRNLKKLIQARLNNKSLPKSYVQGSGMDEDNSETQFESTEDEQIADMSEINRRKKQSYKKIQIFDRFSIILQIFAKRTTSKLAKLQIELSYLAYLKTRLVRDGSTYSSNLNAFSGDLLSSSEISLQIISAKQRRALGIMSGQGESQLQIERRNIKNKEAKIRKQIQVQSRLRQHRKQKDKNKNLNLPIIALVGYTNVGKSAFMNYVMGRNEVESKDLLFQTLKTTSRYIELPSGAKAMLMDTIGFITDLPIEMIDSFKATLEDISHADLVIHLRDLSHPQHELQKQSVLSVLRELKFDTHFYTEKMIEVWNKVDLVESAEDNPNCNSQELRFKVSCLTGRNMNELMQFIDKKIKTIRKMEVHKITYGFEKHYKVIQWLKYNANVSYSLNEHHNYEISEMYPQGSVTIQFQADNAVCGKLAKFIAEISHKQYKKDKSRKGLPPKAGW